MRACSILLALAVLAFAGAVLAADAPEATQEERSLLATVFPQATRFGAPEGEPLAVPAYRDDELLGYAFHTRQVVASAGYSGKPLDVLVGLGLDGRITGARIIEQHEPILVIGVTEEELHAFVRQYEGRDVRSPIEVTRTTRHQANAVDAVSGATISSTVINDVIVRAARAIASSRGLFGEQARRIDITGFEEASFAQLQADGSLRTLKLTVAEAQAALPEGARLFPPGAEPDPEATFAELYFGLATPARIGRNLLGERLYSSVTANLAAGDQVIFVGGRGLYSFKGTAWSRTGVFERLQITQGERTFQLRADQHQRVDELAFEDESEREEDEDRARERDEEHKEDDGRARERDEEHEDEEEPELRELALFIMPAASGFDPAEPWRLELLVQGRGTGGEEVLASFGETYTLPQRYVRQAAGPEDGAAPPEEPLWQRVWRERPLDIAILACALTGLTGILVFQDWIAQRRRLHFWLRIAFLSFTLFWLGWWTTAQLSILNVLTFAEALRVEFRWDFFLLEPLLFVLWSYVAIALLFWGRVFCGWLCPFGALQELTNLAARRLRVPQIRVPFGLHERLAAIKYMVFLALFALSLGPMALALVAAEVEPFKTAIVLRFDRAWPFVVYALALLVASLFIERAFCRYLCPLGAALAIPTKLRLFEWLKRHRQCGAPCQICFTDCPVQAIHPEGRINPNECIYCLACQVNYYDSHVCPPMIERRKRREKRAATIEEIQGAQARARARAQPGEGTAS